MTSSRETKAANKQINNMTPRSNDMKTATTGRVHRAKAQQEQNHHLHSRRYHRHRNSFPIRIKPLNAC
jgi:hypothetical protein